MNTPEDLNEISEEDFRLYKNEAEDIDELLEEELEEAWDDLLDDLDLSKPQSYTPTIRDLERTSAVRHGYYGYEQLPCGSLPQCVRLGPQLIVRTHTACVPFNPKGLSEEVFLEFWLEPIGGVEPSPGRTGSLSGHRLLQDFHCYRILAVDRSRGVQAIRIG